VDGFFCYICGREDRSLAEGGELLQEGLLNLLGGCGVDIEGSELKVTIPQLRWRTTLQ
jgi:hypothetical protein